MQSNGEKQIVTQRGVAEALKVSQRTVYTMTKTGRIPCIRISSRIVRYDLAAVLEALSKDNRMMSIGE
jgi:excisionase family DNA binding protein